MFNVREIAWYPIKTVIYMLLVVYALCLATAYVLANLHTTFNPICGSPVIATTTFCIFIQSLGNSTVSSSNYLDHLIRIESKLDRLGDGPFLGAGPSVAWEQLDQLITFVGGSNLSSRGTLLQLIRITADDLKDMSLAARPLYASLSNAYNHIGMAEAHTYRALRHDQSWFGSQSIYCVMFSSVVHSRSCRPRALAALSYYLDIILSILNNVQTEIEIVVAVADRASGNVMNIRNVVADESYRVLNGRLDVLSWSWGFFGVGTKELALYDHMLEVLARLDQATNTVSRSNVAHVLTLETIKIEVAVLASAATEDLLTGPMSPDLIVKTLTASVRRLLDLQGSRFELGIEELHFLSDHEM
ncbi:hypothetical protein BJ138DRAFT_1127753 [Hygrophoropsis aurantiaca]|uniref:Uncharacterized protein n=1 Tax=Hygrophoropsis aurantiaca TaxID=72124 RepID=A0ACB8A8G1_9AGAM|nr:hypothetical protein BJ138DRAFT_1127753 [Hygrophoropsis aurantiaca]